MNVICDKDGKPGEASKARRHASPPNRNYVRIGEDTYDIITSRIGLGFISAQQKKAQAILRKLRDQQPDAFKRERERIDQEHRKLRGSIGEHHHNQIATKVFGMQPLEYEKPENDHGFDHIYLDKQGNFVYAESKMTESADGIDSLGHPDGKLQGSFADIGHKLKLMQTPGSDLYTVKNAELARTLEQAAKEGRVRSLLFHTNPQSLSTIVSEYGNDGFQPFVAFRFASHEVKG